MILWRLSGERHARTFDGGYGLRHDGRWNLAAHPITYAATSPALCVLEKLVHIEEPYLLPPLMMVRYAAPDGLAAETIELDTLPADWRDQESLTQGLGAAWREAGAKPLLRVPSAIVPVSGSPDTNVLINHRHPHTARISLARVEPFVLDVRLFEVGAG